MFSLRNLRRLCAAIDAFAATCIAASISKSRTKTDVAVSANASNQHPDNFPTIAACRAAILKNRVKKEAEKNPSGSVSVRESALVQMKAERDPEKLFQLFKSNAENRLVVENRFAFEDTVSRLAGARRFDLIEELLEHQRTLPQGHREGFIVRIIMLYGKARMHNHALKVFDEMHLLGCPRTVKSFNAVLKVLSENRSFEEANVLSSYATEKYGIEFDEVSYNTMIQILCQMGRLESAYLVKVEMEKVGIKPDVVTYTTLMSAFYKHGRREIGDGLWNLMVLKGCSPNLATYSVRIQFLINRRRAWQANDLVRKMDAAGIRPHELTYNLVIKGFCMMGEFEMAKRIFYAMHGRGCKPNAKIYQTMVHYLCKNGEFDVAFRLCKDSMENNWFLNIDTINSLLKGLMKISMDRNAREIFKLVKEKQPSYPDEELNAFQDVLSSCKSLKE